MGEVIAQYFQSKKEPFLEEGLSHPLCRDYLGQRIIIRLHPKGLQVSQAGRSCTKVVEDLEGGCEAPEIS